jgi:hypothetical protein
MKSLAGDLFEEYHQGRSRVWYWKEALAAITVGLWRELLAHPVLALRAIALAWALRFLYLYSIAGLVKLILPEWWVPPVSPWVVILWLWWTSVRPVSPLAIERPDFWLLTFSNFITSRQSV